MDFSVITKALCVGGLLRLTPNLYPFSSGAIRLREAKEPGQGHTAGNRQPLSASRARGCDQESGLSPESLWASRLQGGEGGRWARWEGWRAHPHSQREDAASAEPRCEQRPVGTARYGDVALLVVT